MVAKLGKQGLNEWQIEGSILIGINLKYRAIHQFNGKAERGQGVSWRAGLNLYYIMPACSLDTLFVLQLFYQNILITSQQ